MEHHHEEDDDGQTRVLASGEAEKSVLGGILLDQGAFPDVAAALAADDFHQAGHGIIYQAMADVHAAGQHIDLVTLAQRLDDTRQLDSVGGYVALANLETCIMSTTMLPSYVEIVRDKALRRRMMRAAAEIVDLARDEERPAAEQADAAEQALFRVVETSGKDSKGFRPLSDVIPSLMARVAENFNAGGHGSGLATRYPDLDRILGGIEPTALVIIAARPSVGKTAVALNMVRHCAAGGRPVAFYSLEMDDEQLAGRLLSGEAFLPSNMIRDGRMSPEQYERLRTVASGTMDWPFFVDDTPGLSIAQVRGRARRLKAKRPDLACVVVDYLQLMQGERRRGGNRQDEVAGISRSMKLLAKELKCPVFCLSQLSRGVESRGTKGEAGRPVLSDLRESGAIEQDADVVVLLHRTEDVTKRERSLGVATPPVRTELIVAKNRNGSVGMAPLHFFGDWTLFANAPAQQEAVVRTLYPEAGQQECPRCGRRVPFPGEEVDAGRGKIVRYGPCRGLGLVPTHVIQRTADGIEVSREAQAPTACRYLLEEQAQEQAAVAVKAKGTGFEVPKQYEAASLKYRPKDWLDKFADAYGDAEGWADAAPNTTNLAIVGPIGSGKTHLACAVLNSLALRGLSVGFVPVVDLVQKMFDSWRSKGGDEDPFLVRLRGLDVLALDDWARSRNTEAAADMLFSLVNGRYNDGKPTILTMNPECGGIGETANGAPILDRLQESIVLIRTPEVPLRAKGAGR